MNNKWYRLDTAGLIFPAIMNSKWSNVFRLSLTLKEKIDPDILQSAVAELENRFPTMYVSLHKGLFWNYLEKIKSPILVKTDYAYPLTYMSYRQLRKSCMRVFYFNNRIAVEFFHSITDGTGGRIYLCSLVAHYLKLKHNIKFKYNSLILNPNDDVDSAEVEDSFYKNSCDVQAPRKEESAYHLKGKQIDEDYNILTTAFIPTDVLIKIAHEYDCKVTPFLCAVMAKSIMEIQKTNRIKKYQKPVKVTVPINLRRLFNSKTLRNFILTINPGIDPRKGDYTIKELCDSFKHQIALMATKQNMAAAITANTVPQKFPLLKITPLSLKHFVMSLVYNAHGERYSSITISNLGNTVLPEEMNKYVDYMEFIIGAQKNYSNNCSVISINNTTCINMIRKIEESDLEQLFFSTLVELGIPVEVDCNRR